jgi:hypothetical protein
MYRTLFDLAGLAMIGWALLILLPTWKWTRRVAETGVFPLYLSVLYVVGIMAVFRELGPGLMADFGSADGVLGLLTVESVALVAWIHILAFDQVVGVLIYRDNMKYRAVPVPVQSVLLFATLMLGPVGFLSYWAVRRARLRRREAWGEAEPPAVASAGPVAAPVEFGSVVGDAGVTGGLIALLRRAPALVGLAVLGFTLALITSVIAAINGGWLLGQEGRLLEAVKFDLALGIFILTLALILPLAPFTARGRRRWVGWLTGLALFSYGVETIQSWRGLDPRFSTISSDADQILGGLFFLAALAIWLLFFLLIRTFFRPDALPDHRPLRLSLRYAAAGAFMAFGVGLVMSVLGGRVSGAAGDFMLAHAAGFHALQAVPVVALLLGANRLSAAVSIPWTHAAGVGWTLLCTGLVVQALTGAPPAAPSPALALSLAGAAIWVVAGVHAVRVRAMSARGDRITVGASL